MNPGSILRFSERRHATMPSSVAADVGRWLAEKP
jgi:hypothetical protein